MNGRIYDPLLGRFLSADSVIIDPLNLQHYNLYSYVYNNPVNMTDPNGEFGIFGAVGGGIVGGLIGGGIAWYKGGSPGEIAAAAAGGATTGALIGSGAGIIAIALEASTISGGGAVLASVGVGAVSAATGNVVTQVGTNLVNGDNLPDAVSNIDGESVAISAAVGGMLGAVGGGAMVLSNTARASTTEVLSQASSNLNKVTSELVKQGASSQTIQQAQTSIVTGMGNVGRATSTMVGSSAGSGGVVGVAVDTVSVAAGVGDATLNTPDGAIERAENIDSQTESTMNDPVLHYEYLIEDGEVIRN